MTDWLFAEEIKDFVLQLFHRENTGETDDWEALTPIELGVLSWHLSNFYYYPVW